MEFKIKNILVPTNFSNCANNAIKTATEIAQRHSATLHLVHVVVPPVFSRVVNIAGEIFNMEQSATESALSKITLNAEEIAANTLLRIETHVLVGELAPTLKQLEEQLKIDLTIIGTEGINSITDILAESLTFTIAKASLCPVMVVPAEFSRRTFDAILFPIRQVNGILEKYGYLQPILKKNKAALHLLGVYSVKSHDDIYPVTNNLKLLYDKIKNDHANTTFEVVSSSDIPETILDVAGQKNTDLIVINAAFDQKWYHLLSGNSYTHQLINYSPVPILCIKEQQVIALKEIETSEMFVADEGYIPLTF